MWDQSIRELQSQVASLSGKIAQMQQSLGTGWIVMQIRSELMWEYQEILWYVTNQNNYYQDTFRTILWIGVSVLAIILWVIWYFASKYIDRVLKNVSEIEKDIIVNKKFVEDQSQKMFEVQSQLDKQIDVVKLIEKNIESQDSRIFNQVMQSIADSWFLRIQEQPKDINHLFWLITTLDPKFIRERYYETLCSYNENYALSVVTEEGTNFKDHNSFVILIAQFFPDKLLYTESYNAIRSKDKEKILFDGLYREQLKKNLPIILKSWLGNYDILIWFLWILYNWISKERAKYSIFLGMHEDLLNIINIEIDNFDLKYDQREKNWNKFI